MALSKIGPHIINPTDKARQWLRRAPFVRLIDRPELLDECAPGAFTVYRKYFSSQPVLGFSGETIARAILADLGGRRPSAVSLYCMAAQFGNDAVAYWGRIQEAAQVLHAAGIKVAGPGWSSGQPQKEYVLALAAQKWAGLDYLDMQGYWQGPFTKEHALRCDLVHEWTNGEHPPIVYTECGRDGIAEGKPLGWKKQNVTAARYAEEIIAFDRELRSRDYVVGAAVFTAGPSHDWADFDVDELGEVLTAEAPVSGVPTFSDVLTLPGFQNIYRRQILGGLAVYDVRHWWPSAHAAVDVSTKSIAMIHETDVHHNGFVALTQVAQAVRSIGDYHVAQGYGGVGYQLIVDHFGNIWLTGELNTSRAGAAQLPQLNDVSYHVALLGAFGTVPPPTTERAAARQAIAAIEYALGRRLVVAPHCLFNTDTSSWRSKWNTGCPGATWQQWIGDCMPLQGR